MDPSSFLDILTATRRLPPEARSELALALLHEDGAKSGAPSLEPLIGLSDTELRALVGSVLAPGQRRLKNLLKKNREGKLSERDRAELDAMLEESDRVALLKARAAYTLARTDALHSSAA